MVRSGSAVAKGLGTHPQYKPKSGERDQGLVEYALGLTLVAMVVTISLVALGPAIQKVYCQAIYMMNPNSIGGCSDVFSTVDVLKAQFNPGTQEIDLVVKRPDGCEGDLTVLEYGQTLLPAGTSHVAKINIGAGPAPASVTVGSTSCGWSSVALTTP